MQKLGTVSKGSDDSIELRIVREIRASLEDVWAALTESDALKGWLGEVTYEPVVGSVLTIDFGDGIEIYGEVVAIDPLRKFSFTWAEGPEIAGASLVCFELFEGAETTRLVLTHSRQSVRMARSTAAGWHAHMDLLIGYLDGDAPEWEAIYPPAKEAYKDIVATLN